jgi:hypothetical protein
VPLHWRYYTLYIPVAEVPFKRNIAESTQEKTSKKLGTSNRPRTCRPRCNSQSHAHPQAMRVQTRPRLQRLGQRLEISTSSAENIDRPTKALTSVTSRVNACGSGCRWLLCRKLCDSTLGLKLKPNDCRDVDEMSAFVLHLLEPPRDVQRSAAAAAAFGARILLHGCCAASCLAQSPANPAACVWAACLLHCNAHDNRV